MNQWICAFRSRARIRNWMSRVRTVMWDILARTIPAYTFIRPLSSYFIGVQNTTSNHTTLTMPDGEDLVCMGNKIFLPALSGDMRPRSTTNDASLGYHGGEVICSVYFKQTVCFGQRNDGIDFVSNCLLVPVREAGTKFTNACHRLICEAALHVSTFHYNFLGQTMDERMYKAAIKSECSGVSLLSSTVQTMAVMTALLLLEVYRKFVAPKYWVLD